MFEQRGCHLLHRCIGSTCDWMSRVGFVLAIYVAVSCRPAGVKPNGTHFEPQRASVRAGRLCEFRKHFF